jgi:hypothetical protein
VRPGPGWFDAPLAAAGKGHAGERPSATPRGWWGQCSMGNSKIAAGWISTCRRHSSAHIRLAAPRTVLRPGGR